MSPLDPDMPADELRLHMGELTDQEVLTARAAIRWANSAHAGLRAEKEKFENAWHEACIRSGKNMMDAKALRAQVETLREALAGLIDWFDANGIEDSRLDEARAAVSRDDTSEVSDNEQGGQNG